MISCEESVKGKPCELCGYVGPGPWSPIVHIDKASGRAWRYCQACASHLWNLERDRRRFLNPVIVDIDGTVADIDGRDPMTDNGRVLCWDRPVEHVRKIVTALAATGNAVVYVSGRREATRIPTTEWLMRNGFGVDSRGETARESTIRLLMRGDADRRSDEFVKRDILRWLRAGGVQPQFAIDDRPKVIRMWQAEGLPVVQVGRSVGVAGDF